MFYRSIFSLLLIIYQKALGLIVGWKVVILHFVLHGPHSLMEIQPLYLLCDHVIVWYWRCCMFLLNFVSPQWSMPICGEFLIDWLCFWVSFKCYKCWDLPITIWNSGSWSFSLLTDWKSYEVEVGIEPLKNKTQDIGEKAEVKIVTWLVKFYYCAFGMNDSDLTRGVSATL